jgi:hypothetical protein
MTAWPAKLSDFFWLICDESEIQKDKNLEAKRISGRDAPLDKRNERARLGAGEATRRVNGGQIGRRQGPVIQDRHDLSGSQLGRKIPLRRYSECQVAVHRLPHALFWAQLTSTIAIDFTPHNSSPPSTACHGRGNA